MTNQNKKTLLIVVIIALLAVVGGLAVFGSKDNTTQTQTAPSATVTAASTSAKPGAPATPATPAEKASPIDVKVALSNRVLGDESAKVKIEEYGSLTCSHCAHFANDIFPKIKKEYIDTKKAYFVFSDFPLNAPAMHAAMIARCLPEKEYFDFVEMLFKEQDKWGFDPSYLSFLKEKAKEHGLNDATFTACIQNNEIQQGIVKKMEAAQGQWQVSSTPTFVLNNKKVINGAIPEEDFVKAIEDVINNRNQGDTAIPAPAAAAKTAVKPTTTDAAVTAPATTKEAPVATTKTETKAATTPEPTPSKTEAAKPAATAATTPAKTEAAKTTTTTTTTAPAKAATTTPEKAPEQKTSAPASDTSSDEDTPE